MEKKLPELMDIKQLREYFDCGIDAAYMLVRRKDFPSFKLGKRYYIVKDRLVDWVDRQSKKPSG